MIVLVVGLFLDAEVKYATMSGHTNTPSDARVLRVLCAACVLSLPEC